MLAECITHEVSSARDFNKYEIMAAFPLELRVIREDEK